MAENTEPRTILVDISTKVMLQPNEGKDRDLFSKWLNWIFIWESESGSPPHSIDKIKAR